MCKMAAIAKFVFLVVAALTLTIVNAGPAKKSVSDLIDVVEEYRVRFEELGLEKDQLLQFARVALFATYRHMNEDMLINLGNARNTIEFGFDETRSQIADDMLDGGDEECLLDLVSQIVDEQRRLASGMSECAAASNNAKGELSYSFLEELDLLQRLSTAQTEYVLFSFSNHNSFADPEQHAEFLRRTYEESEDLWNDQVRPIIQFEIDAMEYNRMILVAENLECLNELEQQLQTFDDEIREKVKTCVEPFRA
ncbi:uncharacterized protein LOC131432675 [Malaya genurostris]|uniref:uncharacterized protein LOC131432675 n=1 Tax=Malaya genurostris TaxID=325434 RepID=UPI0026F3EAF6|nr:uncharacterized protein LOC131432675 [Malaya genurostris]